MKKSWLLLLATALTANWTAQGEAAIIRIEQPAGIVISAPQPIEVIVIDSYGNAHQQIGYYDPVTGGLSIDTSWAGLDTSIYIPAFGTGYIWYNGYWIDQSGYYWDGTQRIYINYPQWNVYWRNYWHKHGRDRYWHRWRDRDRDDWHRGSDEWRKRQWIDDGWKRSDDIDKGRHDGWKRDGDFEGGRRDSRHARVADIDQSGAIRGRGFEGGRPGGARAGDFDAGQPGDAMRDRSFEGGKPGTSIRSEDSDAGRQGGAMRERGADGGRSGRAGGGSQVGGRGPGRN